MNLKKISFLLLILAFSLSLFLILTINSSTKFISFQTSAVNNQTNQSLNYQHPLIPVVSSTSSIPVLLAESFILVDNDTNTVLLSKKPNAKIYPASTTKLATALTALNIYPLDEVISSQEYKEGKIMNLKSGEKITVKSLISALLIYSANDAAFNLALHHPEGISGFIKEMNLIAQKYNLKDTNFTNFDGIHNPNHFSTVYDLSQFGRIAIKNPIIREIVKTKKSLVSDVENKIQHNLESTNELLDVVPEIEGLKTGWTPEAGGCFVGLININGHKLISVVAQSADRFADTRQIIDWAKKNIEWKEYSI